MEGIFSRLDSKVRTEKSKVLLFWNNTTCHPKTLQTSLTNIKLVFLPKNTTSRLQPYDTGIIRSFKYKYRKLLVLYVVSRIDEAKMASQIIEDIHVLKVIKWLQTACESVTMDTVKQCFKKCGLDAGYASHKRKDRNTEF